MNRKNGYTKVVLVKGVYVHLHVYAEKTSIFERILNGFISIKYVPGLALLVGTAVIAAGYISKG